MSQPSKTAVFAAEVWKEIMKSEKKWVEPKFIPRENHQRKTEPDIFDEMALKTDFANSNPELDTVKRRAVFRPQLDFTCLPSDQKFILLTTWGPTSEYDIKADKTGFQVWGSFENEQQCAEQIAYIRQVNPHAVFVPITPVQLGKRIDFPPPEVGNADGHHLNKEYAKFMNRHLKKVVREAEDVFNRKEDTVAISLRQNEAVDHFNNVFESLKEMTTSNTEEDLDEKNERLTNEVVKRFSEYPGGKRNPNLKTITPGKIEFNKLLEDLQSIHPSLVDAYLKLHETSATQTPPTMRGEYRRVTTADGRVAIVKVLLRPKQKKPTSN